MKPAFVSCRCYGSVLKLLKSFSFDTVLLPELPLIDSRTSYHADLALCVIEDTLVCAPSLYEKLKDINGVSVVKGTAEPFEPYPNDILYNSVHIGDFLICRKDKTDKAILQTAEVKNLSVINVHQGYSRCSTLPISDSAVITSDSSICSSLSGLGLDILFVSNDGVLLDGYPHGFIGGAGGVFENKLIFCGDISKHRDFERIKDFCGKHQVELYSTTEPLRDFGSLLC